MADVKTAYRWSTVAIGGGGYVTGVYPHPWQPGLVYIRTDVGGCYRLDPGPRFSRYDYHTNSIEDFALDPTDPQTRYLAGGMYTAEWWPSRGRLYKSTDKGRTWKRLPLELKMGGNEEKRHASQRLAVDPFDPKTVFFGSRLDGLRDRRPGHLPRRATGLMSCRTAWRSRAGRAPSPAFSPLKRRARAVPHRAFGAPS